MEERIRNKMRVMLISVGILFGAIFLYKGIAKLLLNHFLKAHANPTYTVSTIVVGKQKWQPLLRATGSVRAIEGVNVTTELSGMVRDIYFTPGATVKKGTVLVQLNADSEIAELHAYEAKMELARITYERDKKQYAINAVSKETLDTDYQNWKSLQAQVAQELATVAKKTVRAPFDGRLGICYVNPGQYLNPGDAVTMMQMFNPIYIDFTLPQQALAQLTLGQTVTVTTDTYPQEIFTGKITTINPGIDKDTRNVSVEATMQNPKEHLTPGMFVYVSVKVGQLTDYMTLPQSAVTYNPYGDLVYVIKKEQDKHGKTVLKAYQHFISAGEVRGDQVAILKGINIGDEVVTSGQLKLKNGSLVAVNNQVMPSDAASVSVTDNGAPA